MRPQPQRAVPERVELEFRLCRVQLREVRPPLDEQCPQQPPDREVAPVVRRRAGSCACFRQRLRSGQAARGLNRRAQRHRRAVPLRRGRVPRPRQVVARADECPASRAMRRGWSCRLVLRELERLAPQRSASACSPARAAAIAAACARRVERCARCARRAAPERRGNRRRRDGRAPRRSRTIARFGRGRREITGEPRALREQRRK